MAFLRREVVEEPADAGANGIEGALGGHAQQMLELGEDLLDGIEVRGVFRQEEELGAGRTDGATNGSREVALVTAADKLHNLQAQIRDVRRHGAATMQRFNASPAQVVWYNTQIAAAIGHYRATIPVAEIEEATAMLAGMLGVNPRPQWSHNGRNRHSVWRTSGSGH